MKLKNSIRASIFIMQFLMFCLKNCIAFDPPYVLHETIKQSLTTPFQRKATDESPFFRYLIKQAGKNGALYLIEGEPSREALLISSSGNEENSDTLLQNVSLSDLATRYGYRAEILPSGIVVFHKTYYDERDLPSITLEEWQGAIKDIETSVNNIDPHIPSPSGESDPLANGIINTFTSEQFTAMARGLAELKIRRSNNAIPPNAAQLVGSGLPVNQLTEQQKFEVWRVARHLYVENSLSDLKNVFIQSKSVSEKTSFAFCFHEINGVRVFGYEIKDKPEQDVRFTALSNPYQFVSGPQGTHPILSDPNNFIVSSQNDPTNPVLKNVASIPTVAITLRELAVQLNTQSKTMSNKKVVIKEELAAKRITLAGNIANVNPLDVIRAVTLLYGLRVINTDELITLTRPRGRVTENPSEVGKLLGELLPLPFLNAYNRTILSNDPAIQKVVIAKGVSIETEVAEAGLRWAAIRRLRDTIELKIKNSPNKKVTLTELDDKEKEALTVVLASSFLKTLIKSAQKTAPSFITNFDQTILVGGIERGQDGRQWLTLFMGRRLPNGSLVQGSGFSSHISSR